MKKEIKTQSADLPIHADLTFCSFVRAQEMINDNIPKEYEHIYTYLEINIVNYHQAHKLSTATGDTITINNDLDEDEWNLCALVSKDGCVEIIKIHSNGA